MEDTQASEKKHKEKEFQALYGNPIFKEFKFTVHCRIKSSEQKFADQIKTFSKSGHEPKKLGMSEEMKENREKEVTKPKELLIGWGNWGKTPNKLKGVAPTPGIGIRERFERFFKTVTVDEHYTSPTCPYCKGEPSLRKVTINGTEKHHLLCCTNDICTSRWWNRNTVGSLNILSRLFEMKVSGEETTRTGRKRKQPLKSRT